jgi:hypothetical protein
MYCPAGPKAIAVKYWISAARITLMWFWLELRVWQHSGNRFVVLSG